MSLLNRYTTALPVVFLLTASLLVGWFSWDSYQRFANHQRQLAERSTENAASEIAHQVADYRRAIGLFAGREEKLLQRAAAKPQDSRVFADLAKQFGSYFPDYYSFTIANRAGLPLLKHSNFLLTKNCRRDLSSFARDFKAPTLYVHNFDEPHSLHFDLMTRFTGTNGEKIPFFASFKMASLARHLQSAAISGHDLLLVEKAGQTGIGKAYKMEGTPGNDGSGLNMVRLPTSFEPATASAQAGVNGSNWTVVNIPRAALFSDRGNSLLAKAAVLITIFTLIALAMRYFLLRETSHLERTGRVISGIENDRHRIAMDMHDQVLSDLTYLSRQCDHMRASVEDPPAMLSHLESSEKALENVSDSIRAIIDDLHPQTLEILGLEASLKTYLDKNFSALPNPQITFEAKPFEDRQLSDDQRLNLYRITLEIIHNIVRHAKATKCIISLGMKNRDLVLSVEDDGTKFRPGIRSSAQARGLSNVNTRSAMIGSLVSWSQPLGFSDGTRFELVLPLGSDQ